MARMTLPEADSAVVTMPAPRNVVNPAARLRLYIVLTLVSLALLFYSAAQVRPVVVEPTALLGLVSYLPPAYWLGLGLLLLCSIAAFVDTPTANRAVFMFILITLSLYLIGIAPLVEANARIPEVYYPVSEVKHILETGHLNIVEPYPLVSYRNWPALHFLSAEIMEITGLSLTFVKYAPFVWGLSFVLITWGLGSRLGLSANRAFLLSFLGLASWWGSADYLAKDIAMILYLTLLMLAIEPRKTVGEALLTILVFGGLVVTHGLTSVMALLLLVALAGFRREGRFFLLFATVFGAWYMYQGVSALERAVQLQKEIPMYQFLLLANPGKYQTGGLSVFTREVFRYSQLAYLALYGTFLLGSALFFLRGRVPTRQRRQALALFLPVAASLLLVLSFYGELDVRLYFFGLVPIIAMILLTWPIRIPLIVLMVAFTALLPITRYSMEAGWPQVLTSELRGGEFMASKVSPQRTFFYNWGGNIIFYYDPNLVGVGYLSLAWYPGWPFYGGVQNVNLSYLDGMSYVILSKQGTDSMLLSWGMDPFQRWPQTAAGQAANRIYDNGSFYQVFQNRNLPPRGFGFGRLGN